MKMYVYIGVNIRTENYSIYYISYKLSGYSNLLFQSFINYVNDARCVVKLVIYIRNAS